MPDEQGPNQVIRMTPDEAFGIVETCVEIAMEATREKFTRADKVRMSLAFDLVRDFAGLGVQVAGNMEKSRKQKETAKPATAPDVKGDGSTAPADLHAQLTKAAEAAEKKE